MSLGLLFKAAREAKQLSQNHLLTLVDGISQPNYSGFENGNRRLPDDKLIIMAQILGLAPKSVIKIAAVWHEAEAADFMIQQYFPEYCEDSNSIGPPRKPDGFYRFPAKGAVGASPLKAIKPYEHFHYYEFASIDEYDSEMFCLDVMGDSMEPRIPNGAVLLVKPAKSFVPGGIYVVQTTENETTVKMLEMETDGVTLRPYNDKHSSIRLSGKSVYQAWEVLEWNVKLRRGNR